MPIDIGSGSVHLEIEDNVIPGRYPLKWIRLFHASLVEESDCPFGPGWTTPYFARLTRIGKDYQFRPPTGGPILFPDPQDRVERYETIRDLGSSHEISRQGTNLKVTHWTPKGETTVYFFQPDRNGQSWPLRAMEDATGQGIEIAWDELGRLKGLRQKIEKRTLVIAYSSANRISSVAFRHPDGRQTVLSRYEYDAKGRLSVAFDAMGQAVRYEYTQEGRLFRELAKDSAVFTYKYDDQGRCIRFGGLENYNLKILRYLDHIGWTEVTNSLGKTYRYECLPSGQIIREIDPLGGISLTEYDDYGRTKSITGPLGGKKSFEYDDKGNRVKITDALGLETALEYNSNHLIICEIDSNGGRWERKYDDLNRIVSATDPLGSQYSIAYDPAGNPVQIKNPDGGISRRKFSENGDLLESTDWEGRATIMVRNEFGRIIQRREPNGSTTTLRYDSLGRITLATDDQNRVIGYEYDAVGNIIRWSSSLASPLYFRYGTCQRLLERKQESGETTTFKWGSESNRLEFVINDRGETYSFEYDACNRVIKETGFDSLSISFKYDQSGRRIGKTNGLGQSINWKLDPLGRIISEKLFNGEHADYQYDSLGNLSSAENAFSRITFERDALGRILKEDQNGFEIRRSYGSADLLTRLETDAGIHFSYAYDGNGLVSSLDANGLGRYNFTRNSFDQVTAVNLPGEMRLDQTFDTRGRLLNQVVTEIQSGSRQVAPLISRDYTYDDSDMLLSVLDGRWGETRYKHDQAKRLVEFQTESTRIEYRLGPAGDPTSIIFEGGKSDALTYEPGGVLVARGSLEYAYDGAGRLISKYDRNTNDPTRKWHYTWDARDRLRSVTTPSGDKWEYGYDPFGRRVEKKGPDGTIRFIWNEYLLLHEIEGNGKTRTWGFEPDGFKPLFKIKDGTLYSIINDSLGAPREMLDSQGKTVWAVRLDPWGKPTDGIGNLEDCPFRLQGQYSDVESGLHYNNFRYYDPENGKFISQDPLRLDGGISLYQYTPNPLSWIDPLGLCHSTPWDKMTKEEKNALKHSYSRHGEELGLPNWREKNAPELQKQFLAVTGYIKENGTQVPGPIYKPWNGSSVEVNFYEANLQGTKYYYYEDKSSGQFISAGKAR